MGLFDKLKSYLSEEDISEEILSEEAPEKKEKRKTSKSNETSKQKRSGSKSKQRSKKKRQDEDDNIEPEYDSLESESTISYGNMASPDEREYVKDICEQLIDLTYQMEDMKRDYKSVTEYLTDIQRYEELPIDMVNDILDTARRIEMLDKSRETYLQSENLLSMEQYNKIEAHENDIVDTIKNLNDMEMRDAVLKNDMGHLEGEKDDLKFMRDEYTDSIFRVRGIVITVLVMFLLSTLILGLVAVTAKASVTVYSLIVGAVAVVSFVVAYVRYLDIKKDIKYTDAKIKRAISLLNKVKVKFINNTNALEYVYEKYDVNSSKELEYQWAQYNQMVRDEKRYVQANSDFRVCCDELVDKLKRVGIKDPLVWPKQTRALLDKKEMVEIKHALNTRRQKIREQLANAEKNRRDAKTVLELTVETSPGLESYIKEILLSYNLEM